MGQPNYECLPQRAPRQKRKRDASTLEKATNASDTGNADGAPNKNIITTAATTGAGGEAPREPKEAAENEKAVSETVSEPAEYRACAEPGQKFECK
jgi:hypothetical protein